MEQVAYRQLPGAALIQLSYDDVAFECLDMQWYPKIL